MASLPSKVIAYGRGQEGEGYGRGQEAFIPNGKVQEHFPFFNSSSAAVTQMDIK